MVNDWNRETHWPKAFVRETTRAEPGQRGR
ncbi:hypothetical protein [Mycobacterium sp. E2733]